MNTTTLRHPRGSAHYDEYKELCIEVECCYHIIVALALTLYSI